jgi:hypothetical protein
MCQYSKTASIIWAAGVFEGEGGVSDNSGSVTPLAALYREKVLDAAMEPDPKKRAIALVLAEIFNPDKVARGF